MIISVHYIARNEKTSSTRKYRARAAFSTQTLLSVCTQFLYKLDSKLSCCCLTNNSTLGRMKRSVCHYHSKLTDSSAVHSPIASCSIRACY